MDPSRMNRRGFLGTAGTNCNRAGVRRPDQRHGAGPGYELGGIDLRLQSPGADPSPAPHRRTGDRPGLGTFLTFDLKPGDSRDALQQVLERYIAAGVRVVDTSPLYGSAEVSVGQFMGEFEGSDDMLLANKVWATGEYLGDESRAVESFRQRRAATAMADQCMRCP